MFFESVVDTIVAAVVMSAAVVLAASLAQGRGAFIVRSLFSGAVRLTDRDAARRGIHAEVPRDTEWALVGDVMEDTGTAGISFVSAEAGERAAERPGLAA